MTTPAVSVEGLRKVYPRRKGPVVAVDGVSFTIAPKQIVGLLGPNGAGKTTTIKSLCTLVRPTAGSIHLDGVDALAHPRRAVEKVAAVLEGNRNVYWRMTVRENLELFAALQGLPRRMVRDQIDQLIERFALGEKADVPARTLSKGMQQKLALGCAFIKQTPIVVLDEPTLGLDVEASHELRALLRELRGDRTILFSSHDMAVVEDVCERVVIINDGRVVVDDAVDNLLGLFRARAYAFTLDTSLPAAARRELAARYPLSSFADVEGRDVVTVELLDGDDFYGVIDQFRAAGVVVDSVDRRYPDLEEVFLSIVQGVAR